MTSSFVYSNINNENNLYSDSDLDLGDTTLNQGLKFKKYQSKIAKKTEFEGFQNQTDNNLSELNALQNKFNNLLQQYNGSNSTFLDATKNYVQNYSATDNKNTNVYVNSVVNGAKSNYIGCYADKSTRAMTGTTSLSGQYVTYDQCKESAINAGYKYFGLQAKTSNNTGWCAVSNDLSATKQYGESLNDNSVALWSSKTSGTGNTATVSQEGKILVKDADGKTLWESPNAPQECTFNGGINDITATWGANCNGVSGNATDSVINSTNPYGLVSANYVIGKDMQDVAQGCQKAFDISYKCGNVNKNSHIAGESIGQNFLMDCTTEFNQCKFKLNLQNDGNMCLYKDGATTSLWCTSTNGQQKKTNPNWISTKGKYGFSYLTTGQVLAGGEFIGSDDGSIMLIMQTDGNLVLYTSDPQTNCSKGQDGNMYGGSWANAVYELDKVGNPKTMGKVGYVNDSSKLAEYPNTMFTIDATTKMPIINNNESCTKKVIGIDTLEWDKYSNTGVPMSNKTVCGLKKATQNENINNEALRKQLASLADEIVNKITYMQSLNSNLNNQMSTDKNMLEQNLTKYRSLSKQYNEYNTVEVTNINGILSDSDITVLQENYSYLFWSILAVAVVVITINAIRK